MTSRKSSDKPVLRTRKSPLKRGSSVTSVKKSSSKVTERYDTHLPVLLKLRGLEIQTPTESLEISVSIVKSPHPSSPHVLCLRENTTLPLSLPASVAMSPTLVSKPEASFEEFAEQFYRELEDEPLLELTPSVLPATPSEEKTTSLVSDAGLQDQLLENDQNKKRSFRLHFARHSSKIVPSVVKAKKLDRIVTPRIKKVRTSKTPLFPLPSLRPVMAFLLVSFVFVLPLHAMQGAGRATHIKDQVLNNSSVALRVLEDAAKATTHVDFSDASAGFATAGSLLAESQDTLQTLSASTRTIASLLPSSGRELRTGESLLALGRELSIGAERLSEGFSSIANLKDTDLTTKLEILASYVKSATPHLQSAETTLAKIDINSIPEEDRALFQTLSNALPSLTQGLTNLQSTSEALLDLLGNTSKKRYLFVFQNDTEIRPTGGFIGSFAEVDLYRGELVGFSLPGDGSYNLQGQNQDFVRAPKPLQLLNGRFEFQDANWFPNFKTSAEKLLSFHEASGGPTVDGVIAINASYVASLLNIVGPIELPAYGRTITADNFLIETQKIVEQEYDPEENKPKAFLGDLAPLLLERLKSADAEQFLPLIDALKRGLSEKDIQLYFTTPEAQAVATSLGWTGELQRTKDDYLMVVNANIGGQKTDVVIEETVDLHSLLKDNGTIENTLTITRSHHGIVGADFTGVNNVNYVRIYVPRGSELVSVEGSKAPLLSQYETPEAYLTLDPDLAFIEASTLQGPNDTTISEEADKTVFGTWTQTKPGETSVLTITYLLPLPIAWPNTDTWMKTAVSWMGFVTPVKHSLLVEPQSGTHNRTTTITLQTESKAPIWTTGAFTDGAITKTLQGPTTGFLAMLFDSSL